MLGRLLRTSSFADLMGNIPLEKEDGRGAQHHLETTPPPAVHIPDELKVLLYGCKKVDSDGRGAMVIPSFRLIIAQELGRLLSRDNYQVVLDYTCSKGGTTGMGTGIASSVESVPLSELKEYIFGSPVRISDRCQSDKLKLIKSAHLVVATRIFYNTSSATTPYPNQRIAICCCMPESFLTVLTECWSRVSKWFHDCQGVLGPLLEAEALLPKDLKASSQPQVEAILNKFYRNLIYPFQSLLETHRLFLYPEHLIDFTTSWYKEVFNWLEVKDGHRIKFLPVLLAKIKFDTADELVQNRASRIVVMSGNATVANKLIFIISAFLKPRYQGEIHFVDSGSATPSSDSKPMPSGTKYDSTITSKGWEIPRKQSTSSVLSKSSDETSFAHVFLPSSLRSTSSLQYISSSLNSQYGSYGSWFKKAMPLSHSPKANDSPESAFLHQRNNSTTSLHQHLLTSNGGSINNGYASTTTTSTTPTTNRWSQGSPSVSEYEEYPWLGSTNTASGLHIRSKIQKVNMHRNTNRVHDEKLLHARFTKISGELGIMDFHTSPATDTHSAVLEVPITEDLSFPKQELLPPYASYMHNVDPLFQVQACPISVNTERRVVEYMKNDLQYSDCSKTLLVSLRSREIKEVAIIREQNTRNMIQRTTKIFQHGKQGSIPQKLSETVQFIDSHLSSLWKKWEDPIDPEDKIRMLHESFQALTR